MVSSRAVFLAPTIFSIFLSLVHNHAFTDHSRRVSIQSRPGADLFNVNQCISTRGTQKVLMRDFMFADDTAYV